MRGKKHPLTTTRKSANDTLPALSTSQQAKAAPALFVKNFMTSKDKEISGAGSSSPGEVVFVSETGNEFIISDYDYSDPGSLGESLRTLLVHHNEIQTLNAKEMRELFMAWHKERCTPHELYRVHDDKVYEAMVESGEITQTEYDDGPDISQSNYSWGADWTYRVVCKNNDWQIEEVEYHTNFVVKPDGVHHEADSIFTDDEEMKEIFNYDLPTLADHWINNIVGKSPSNYKL